MGAGWANSMEKTFILQMRNLRHKEYYRFFPPLASVSPSAGEGVDGTFRGSNLFSAWVWGGGDIGFQGRHGQEHDMAQSCAWSLEVLPAHHLPGDVVALLGGEPPGASEEPPVKPPENPWPACCRPCPMWVSVISLRPRPCCLGSCFFLRGSFCSLVC